MHSFGLNDGKIENISLDFDDKFYKENRTFKPDFGSFIDKSINNVFNQCWTTEPDSVYDTDKISRDFEKDFSTKQRRHSSAAINSNLELREEALLMNPSTAINNDKTQCDNFKIHHTVSCETTTSTPEQSQVETYNQNSIPFACNLPSLNRQLEKTKDQNVFQSPSSGTFLNRKTLKHIDAQKTLKHFLDFLNLASSENQNSLDNSNKNVLENVQTNYPIILNNLARTANAEALESNNGYNSTKHMDYDVSNDSTYYWKKVPFTHDDFKSGSATAPAGISLDAETLFSNLLTSVAQNRNFFRKSNWCENIADQYCNANCNSQALPMIPENVMHNVLDSPQPIKPIDKYDNIFHNNKMKRCHSWNQNNYSNGLIENHEDIYYANKNPMISDSIPENCLMKTANSPNYPINFSEHNQNHFNIKETSSLPIQNPYIQQVYNMQYPGKQKYRVENELQEFYNSGQDQQINELCHPWKIQANHKPVYMDDHDRMIYVSWIPKRARAYNTLDKRRMEFDLKKRLKKDLTLHGLSKILLFPPRGVHCKLIFNCPTSAAEFMKIYGGDNMSPETEKWKEDLCRIYDIDMKNRFDKTVVKIEWSQK